MIEDLTTCEKTTGDLNVAIWEKYYSSLNEAYLFPNEYVVRSFLGTYPNLKMDHNFSGKTVCDVSCGDGRNLTALNKFGLVLHATEISQAICDRTKRKLASTPEPTSVDIRSGSNTALPFADASFDYVLSWNACYYMQDENSKIADNIAELARITKPNAYLICSVPMPGCFSLQGSEDIGNGLIRLKTNSKWGMLNGSIYHRFDSFEDIENRFGEHFHTFQKCTITDDCYGLALQYFVFVCQRK